MEEQKKFRKFQCGIFQSKVALCRSIKGLLSSRILFLNNINCYRYMYTVKYTKHSEEYQMHDEKLINSICEKCTGNIQYIYQRE